VERAEAREDIESDSAHDVLVEALPVGRPGQERLREIWWAVEVCSVREWV